MKLANLDEWYCWQTVKADDTHRYTRKSYPSHYAKISQDLWDRLKAAEQVFEALQAEVEKFAGKEKD